MKIANLKNSSATRLTLLAATLVASGIAAQAANFVEGRVVAVRVGDGVTASTAANVVTILEFNTATPAPTVPTKSIELPYASGDMLTLGAVAGIDGQLSLSKDGHYLTVGGYKAAKGTANVTAVAVGTAARVVGRINWKGDFDTATTLRNYSSTIRCCTSTTGQDFWVAGGAAPQYVARGGTAGTVLANGGSYTASNTRSYTWFNGSLYFGTGSNAMLPIYSIATTVTSGTMTNAVLPGTAFTAANAMAGGGPIFQGVMISGSQVGYVIDTGAAYNITKILFDGTNWVKVGATTALSAGNVCGLAAYYDGTNVKIYYNTAANIYQLTDTGGTSAFTITETLPGTIVGTAGTNYFFKGIAMAPSAGTLANVVDYKVTVAGTEAKLAWTTQNEPDCMGYNVYVANAINGTYKKANAGLIPAKGDPFNGATYTFTTAIAAGQTLYFKIEDLDHKGVSTMHDVVTASALAVKPAPAPKPLPKPVVKPGVRVSGIE